MRSTKTYLALALAGAGILLWGRRVEAEEDEFAAFREMEKKAFAAFEAMDEGVRRAWEHREQELARTWEEERTALLQTFGEVEKESRTDPLKTVRTDARSEDQVAQSQIDFAGGKVKVEVVVVAASAAEARQQAEKLAREKIQETALEVPAAGDQTLQEQAQDPEVAQQQQEILKQLQAQEE